MEQDIRDRNVLAALPRPVALPLTTKTTFVADSALIVVAGDLDPRTCENLAGAAQSAVDRGATRLTFDMAGVGFMDSSGLRALLGSRDIALVTLRSPSKQVRIVIDVSGLADALPIE